MTLFELAQETGIPFAKIRDYEDYGDEFSDDGTLKDIALLSTALHVRPEQFFSDAPPVDYRISLRDLARRLSEFIQAEGGSEELFGDRVGWDIKPFVENPATGLSWCAKCLRDVCGEIGINWLRCLPDTAT